MRLRKHAAPLIVVLVAAVSLLGFTAYAAHADVINANCQLVVPADPLSAAGLATPYQLAPQAPADGPCNESDSSQSAFVEAAVLDPVAGTVGLYHPLVVDAGTQPVAPPALPLLPPHAVVAVWFGSNGDTLKLVGPGAFRAVNGLGGGDLFGQFAYINAPALFAAANVAIAQHKLVVPKLGVATDGLPCPTTRDFSVVDQDQSDNVATAYWAMPNGQMSQSPVDGATKMSNGSDEGLLAKFVDPSLGCQAWQLPSLDGGPPQYSLFANELMAAKRQSAPVARVPLNDPMTLTAGGESLLKTDLYRAGVDQHPLNPFGETDRAYCRNLTSVFTARAALDAPQWAAAPSPSAGVPLGVFLAARYAASLDSLGCAAPTPPHPAYHWGGWGGWGWHGWGETHGFRW